MKPTVPLGFNADNSEPAPQGPYYTGAGFNVAIGRRGVAGGAALAGLAELLGGKIGVTDRPT